LRSDFVRWPEAVVRGSAADAILLLRAFARPGFPRNPANDTRSDRQRLARSIVACKRAPGFSTVSMDRRSNLAPDTPARRSIAPAAPRVARAATRQAQQGTRP
jgi:hypothetical protein